MSRHPVRGLAAGFLLSLTLGACAAAGPAGPGAEGAPADRLPQPAAASPVNDHAHHHVGDQPAAPVAPAAPKKVTGPTVPTTATPKPAPGPAAATAVRFATPGAAMRYLATAYNRHDLVALRHVTTPVARESLDAMRPMAENLRLVGCERNADRGDYLCEFTHDYPASAHLTGRGSAHFTAAPADRAGWYMTVLNDCN